MAGSLWRVMRESKKKDPGAILMQWLATPEGSKFMMDAFEAKKNVSSKLRGLRDFAGLPSFSDHDKVERAIDRIARRLHDVETELRELDEAIDAVEKRVSGEKGESPMDAGSLVPAPASTRKPKKSAPSSSARKSPPSKKAAPELLSRVKKPGAKTRRAAPKKMSGKNQETPAPKGRSDLLTIKF
ncbi:hypothetical protein K8I61_12295 [bacterium]|nr:hypothetical protein [bacterium]